MHPRIRNILSCKFLSNKESPAPVVYCLLQLIILSSLVIACPYFIDFSHYKHVAVFWLIVCASFVLYFVTHYMDPGYIPYDAVFFTDQDESSQAQTPAHSNLKVDSVRPFKGQIAFPIQAENFFASGKTNLGEIFRDSNDERKDTLPVINEKTVEDVNGNGQTVEKLSTADKNTNTPRAPSGLVQSMLGKSNPDIKEEKTKEDITPFEEKLNTIDDENENKSTLQDAAKNKLSQDVIVECEASIEELEDHTQDPTTFNKTDSKLQSLNQDDFKHDIEANMNKIMKARTYNSIHSAQELEKSQGKFAAGSLKGIDGPSQTNITQTKSQIGGSENITEDAKETQRDNNLVKPLANKVYRELEDSKERTSSARALGLMAAVKMNSPSESLHTRDMLSSPDNTRNVQFFMKKHDEQIELDDMKDHKEGEPLYVERRYCTACNLEQPFRSKHCRDCNRCIAQFDHHCPWLGTCIGEKNHMIFYWFLVVQAAEIAWGEFKLFEQVIKDEHDDWVSQSSFNIIVLLAITFFFVMVVLLWSFHTYLAMKNLTTWEALSWDKISYLKDWKVEWGSPFSQGIFGNLYFFCCAEKTQLQKWKLPKFKRNLEY